MKYRLVLKSSKTTCIRECIRLGKIKLKESKGI